MLVGSKSYLLGRNYISGPLRPYNDLLCLSYVGTDVVKRPFKSTLSNSFTLPHGPILIRTPFYLSEENQPADNHAKISRELIFLKAFLTPH